MCRKINNLNLKKQIKIIHKNRKMKDSSRNLRFLLDQSVSSNSSLLDQSARRTSSLFGQSMKTFSSLIGQAAKNYWTLIGLTRISDFDCCLSSFDFYE